MPDETDLPRQWLSDEIVSVKQGAESELGRPHHQIRIDSKDPYLRIQFVNVFVRDQECSLRFFVDQLGFRLLLDVSFASGHRWIQVSPPDGTASLALVLPRPGSDEERFVGNGGPITFLTEDVESKYREWTSRGVKFTVPLQTPNWGGTFCRFEDIDGNQFGLAGFDEATREIEAARRSHTERIEAERRAAQELEIAKQVQARLFPQRLPHVPGLDYAGICIQARSVGGDYYDFLDLGDGRLALIVGDIAGKGMAASLLMANLQANMRSQSVSAAENPAQFLTSVNRLLFANTTANAYATLFFSDFDHRDGRLLYANCGHLPALILRANGAIHRLEPTCTVVGLFEQWQCVIAETNLNPGDVFVLYTDGVTESPNTMDEEFGEQRLVESLLRHRQLPAEQMARALLNEVVAFSASDQFDDITLIIARRDDP